MPNKSEALGKIEKINTRRPTFIRYSREVQIHELYKKVNISIFEALFFGVGKVDPIGGCCSNERRQTKKKKYCAFLRLLRCKSFDVILQLLHSAFQEEYSIFFSRL